MCVWGGGSLGEGEGGERFGVWVVRALAEIACCCPSICCRQHRPLTIVLSHAWVHLFAMVVLPGIPHFCICREARPTAPSSPSMFAENIKKSMRKWVLLRSAPVNAA